MIEDQEGGSAPLRLPNPTRPGSLRGGPVGDGHRAGQTTLGRERSARVLCLARWRETSRAGLW